MVDQRAVAKQDLSELDKLFSDYNDLGKKVKGIKQNLKNDKKTALRLLRELKNEARFEFLPDELHDSLEKCLDSLEDLIRGNDTDALTEMKKSRKELEDFLNKSDQEAADLWGRKYLEIISRYNGEEVIRQEGDYKVLDMSATDIGVVIQDNTGVKRTLIPIEQLEETLGDLYQKITIEYGRERNLVEFSVIGNNEEMVKTTAKSMLLNRIDFKELKQEARNLNSAMSNLVEAEEAVLEAGYPRYHDLGHSDKSKKMKDYVAREMMKTAEQVLEINIPLDQVHIKMKTGESKTGYTGKNRSGEWVIQFKENAEEVTMFDLMKDAENKPLEEIKQYLKNAPLGVEEQGDNHTPSRAPDVFMVDLVHELGHAVSDIAAEQVLFERDTKPADYGSLVKDELGTKRFEEAANELAGATLKRLSGNMGNEVWNEIYKGFEGYLELTKYDKPVKGYRAQHPIQATSQSLRSLYNLE